MQRKGNVGWKNRETGERSLILVGNPWEICWFHQRGLACCAAPRSAGLNSRNCTIAMFMGAARCGRFVRCPVNRPSRRLDGKLNYKDPDWLDPLEAHCQRKDRAIPPGHLRANKFWNCIRDGTMNLSVFRWPVSGCWGARRASVGPRLPVGSGQQAFDRLP